MLLRNKRIYSLVLALFMVVGIIVPSTAFAEAETVKLTILGTTDLHANIYNWSYEDGKETEEFGMTKVYSVIQKIRDENPNTILIDIGDAPTNIPTTRAIDKNKLKILLFLSFMHKPP